MMTPTSPITRRTLFASGAFGATVAGGLATTTATHGYTNPVIETNHPDPGILAVGSRYYLYSTAGDEGNMPVLTSRDLVRWTLLGDAQPEIASWTRPGRHWAPEII